LSSADGFRNLALDVVPQLGVKLALDRAAAEPAAPEDHSDSRAVLRIRPIALPHYV
jgi:hypothetical protein